MSTNLKELNCLRPLDLDFLQSDEGLQSLFNSLCLADQKKQLSERLADFSRHVSGEWDQLARESAQDYDGPRIESYDRVGNPIDQVWLPPPVRQLRREVVEAGIFENGSELERFAKVYLLAHLGEASLTCPLACTEGLIRVIEAVGSDFLKKEFLPKLRSAETPLAGSQFITEQDMGSDVGALTTRAVPEGEGSWRLYGEKWFCSAIDEFFLIAARPEGSAEGTDGVAIFFVPRTVEGKLNNLRIKRLKQKIGTKELPTAEIDLNGALAYNIGPVEQGFKNLMNYVINTSRIMNAASACGVMARASLEATHYAQNRSAFGRKIIEYPMVGESLNKIRAILESRRALYFYLVSERDRNPLKNFTSDEALWQRFLINICKYRTSIGATECSHEAILILAGNGTIETFSILPRLYRDSLVIETWEGTHNTLVLQIARDGLRFPFRNYLQENILKRAERLGKRGFASTSEWLIHSWKETTPLLDRLTDSNWVAREARRLTDRLGSLLEVAFYADLAALPAGPRSREAGLLEFLFS
ncbi:MAG: acyl-CoA dehydrogenase family protein [Deltaproteobacteria bacterium]|nr:acyl-CoA dehydrogenase family protein [Deltaproteobacteria bacterium]